MTAWSKRAAQIAAEAGPTIDEYEQTLGRDLTRDERAAVTKTAVLKTRPPKDSSTDVSVLHGRWRAEAAALGWDADRLRDAVQAASRAARPAAGAARIAPAMPAAAVVQAGRRKGVFSRADLTIEVAATLPLAAASGQQVLAAIEHLTDLGVRTSADRAPRRAPRRGHRAGLRHPLHQHRSPRRRSPRPTTCRRRTRSWLRPYPGRAVTDLGDAAGSPTTKPTPSRSSPPAGISCPC